MEGCSQCLEMQNSCCAVLKAPSQATTILLACPELGGTKVPVQAAMSGTLGSLQLQNLPLNSCATNGRVGVAFLTSQ
jgi:hypothetical protein